MEFKKLNANFTWLCFTVSAISSAQIDMENMFFSSSIGGSSFKVVQEQEGKIHRNQAHGLEVYNTEIK